MKRTLFASLSAVAVVAITYAAVAQPPGGRGQDGGRGRGRGFGPPGQRFGGGPAGPPPNRLLDALDTDGNQEISATELKDAVAALKKLDRNGDGKITGEEVHGHLPGRPPGEGGPNRAGRPIRERGGAGPNSSAAQAFVERLRTLDRDGNGTVSKDELPERMQNLLARHDTNKDGALDKAELEQIAAGANRNPGRARNGRPGRSGDGPRGRGPRGGGGRFRPGPERFVQHALTFDDDSDGKLDKSELTKLAREMGRRGRRPGRAGEGGPQGRRFGRGGNRGRPARPESD